MSKIFRLLATLFLAVMVGVGVLWVQFYGDAVRSGKVIFLSSNDIAEVGYDRIVDSLVMPNITHHAAFNLYAKRLNLPTRIKSGRYELRKGQSVVEIVRMLKLSLQSPVEVTFNNIRTAAELAGSLSRQIRPDSVELLRALTSPKLAAECGLRSGSQIVSLFIPNTYEVWWDTTPEQLVRRMKRESDAFWNESREQSRKALRLSRVEVSTLASIVQEECSSTTELRRVAGVYLNRLRSGMKLQADPTVKFAVGDFTLRRILYKHLEHDSPYNTYIYKGLPPSPICLPSITSLDAVLNPESHRYYYFCARPELDGLHNFATTYSQHLVYARKYSEALNRRGIR